MAAVVPAYDGLSTSGQHAKRTVDSEVKEHYGASHEGFTDVTDKVSEVSKDDADYIVAAPNGTYWGKDKLSD